MPSTNYLITVIWIETVKSVKPNILNVKSMNTMLGELPTVQNMDISTVILKDVHIVTMLGYVKTLKKFLLPSLLTMMLCTITDMPIMSSTMETNSMLLI
jgi:hypothetical protein